MDRKLLTVSDSTVRLGVSRTATATVYMLCLKGELEYEFRRVGMAERLFIYEDSLEKYLAGAAEFKKIIRSK